jgi:uncharacterized Zn-finger protein
MKGKPRCKTCGEEFWCFNALVCHMSNENGENSYCAKEIPWGCEICGQYFNRKDGLKKHMMTHTAIKPYACKTCGKMFACPQGVTQHMRTHSTEGPYTCVRCGKMFKSKGGVRKHVRTHPMEEP